MGSFSDTPALIAGGDVYPFRFVKPSTTADDTGLQADGATVPILGVSDGSTRIAVGTGSDKHAISGDPITLQGGATGTVLVECAGNITRGAFVESDADGKAVTATITVGATRYHGFVALQSGAAGRIIRIQRVAGMRTYPTTP